MSPHNAADRVASFYDDYGRKEWERLERDAYARLIGHLHRVFLAEVLEPGMRVLDAGCGAGRFALQCLEAGARVTLLDVSPVQVDLSVEYCAEHRDAIDGAHVGDVRDLSALEDASYDIVLCYGSVLCYVLEALPQAMAELAARVRPGGALVASVGSRSGMLRFALANTKLDPADFFGRPEYWHLDSMLASGDLPAHPDVSQPARHFFRGAELAQLLESAGLTQVELGTAPSVSSCLPERVAAAEASPRAWETLLAVEEASYREAGLVDTGEFILARARRGLVKRT